MTTAREKAKKKLLSLLIRNKCYEISSKIHPTYTKTIYTTRPCKKGGVEYITTKLVKDGKPEIEVLTKNYIIQYVASTWDIERATEHAIVKELK